MRASLGVLMLLAAAAVAAGGIEQQREWYLEAKAALRQDRLSEYRSLLARLDDYPLKPYLEAAALRRRLDGAAAGEVMALLRAHPGLPPVEEIRRLWLKRLARERRHDELLQSYTPQSDSGLRCSHLNARLELGLAPPFEPDLWLAGRSRPPACNPVFAHFQAAGAITDTLYWERAKLAAGTGEGRLASELATRLFPEQRASIDRWVGLTVNPERGLNQARLWPDTEINREMVQAALKSLARRRTERARHHWSTLEKRFDFSEESRAEIERDLALYHATDYPAGALARLYALPRIAVDEQILEWRIRVALRAGNWDAALAAIDDLTDEQRGQARWRYWRARALLALGQAEAAAEGFGGLATEANYYGFLSAERLGVDYPLCPEVPGADEATLAELRAMPAMQRAVELYHVGELHHARQEWNLANRELEPEQRSQAALLAAAEGWVDRTILTLADTGQRQAYELRFPLKWESLVAEQAARTRLDPSLLYAVMRAESALVTDAVSSAGAMGLMQLTAPTARRLARQKGWPPPSRARLSRPEVNIALGSAYLAELLERYRHPLPALAAFNAGPEAVDRWQDLDLPAEADRWIETVPYFETREYLARVIAFAAIYDWRREGKILPLALRMPALDLSPARPDSGARGGTVPTCPQPG